MKNTLKYYYDIEIDDLKEQDGKYFFKYQNRYYFFVFFNRNIEELEDILTCIKNMFERGIDVHKMIYNKFGQILTKINDYNYVLMEVNNYLEKFDINDIVNISNKLTLNNESTLLYRNNWEELWSKKVDYFEYQIRELGLNKPVVKDSLSYYIGLAENAISYTHNTNIKYPKSGSIVLSHRRIFYPNYKLNFFNPLSFIFDLEVRDISEYLKAMFFSNQDLEEETFEELEYFLKIKRLTNYEYAMLYSRLLYPSYYFDIYEDIMNKEKNEEDLLKIIKKSTLYEEFLKKAYLEISKYAAIDKIDWIINQH